MGARLDNISAVLGFPIPCSPLQIYRLTSLIFPIPLPLQNIYTTFPTCYISLNQFPNPIFHILLFGCAFKFEVQMH